MKFTSCSRLLATAGAATALTAGAFAQSDECATATNLAFDTPTAFDTTGATPSTPDFSCAPFGGTFSSQDVWFEFTSPVDYAATVTTCNTATYDTKIEIYTGSCGALTSVGCFEDTTGCAGFTTVADFMATAGTQYFVRIGGWNSGEFGTGTVLLVGPPAPPYECVDAAPIAFDTPTPYDTTMASVSMEPWGCTANLMGDVWFTFVASADYMAAASTCGIASYDTRIEVYSGSCGALVSEGCNDDFSGCPGFTSAVSWSAVNGTQYWVRVGGFNASSVGAGNLVVTGPPPAVTNDNCIAAIGLSNGVAELFDNTLATFSSGAGAFSCGNGSGDPLDIWYDFTVVDDGMVDISLCNSSFDTRVEVYTGDCGTLTSVACNDDSCALQSALSFPGTAGTTYIVRVAGFSGNSGMGEIVATYPDSLANDDCSGALPIGAGVTLYNNALATNSGVDMSCVFNGEGRDLWFSYTASADCPVSVDLSGSAYDTGLAIYDGDCMMLNEVACDDDGGTGLDSFASFSAVSGTTYYIQVGGFNGAAGDGILTLTEGLGSIVCVGNVNSTGVGASLKADGSLVAADNNLTLLVDNLPLNQNVLFVNSRETIFVANPGGSMGDLCIGSFALGRHINDVMNSGAAGSVALTLDLAAIPTNLGFVAALAGETWYWQAWYRDVVGGMATSNLSGAVGVTFQ